ncbi:hypothetical protein [Lysobacter gummosus]|uniref:hypothetical protein n=1 Tax=Lysobacter gummosus TaxID=262324 RepID=UPI003631F87A
MIDERASFGAAGLPGRGENPRRAVPARRSRCTRPDSTHISMRRPASASAVTASPTKPPA